MAQVTLPISITLDKTYYDTLIKDVSPNVQPIDVLSRKAQAFLESFALGGVMLKPDQVSEIERNCGKSISHGDDVVRATEAPAKKSGGRAAFEVTIDPTWMVPFEDLAKTTGRTVEALISDMWEFALQNNWAYNFRPAFPPVYIGDYAFLQEFTGTERPTGEELISAIKELQRRRPAKRIVQSQEVGEVATP